MGAASAPRMTNFFVYMIGVILVVGALAYGASLLGLELDVDRRHRHRRARPGRDGRDRQNTAERTVVDRV